MLWIDDCKVVALEGAIVRQPLGMIEIEPKTECFGSATCINDEKMHDRTIGGEKEITLTLKIEKSKDRKLWAKVFMLQKYKATEWAFPKKKKRGTKRRRRRWLKNARMNAQKRTGAI